MLLNFRRHLAFYLTLALVNSTQGLVSEGPNQCSAQISDIYPGENWNITVPYAKCLNAELQLSNGSIRSLPTTSAGCASNATQTDLQLGLSDSVPQGSLNMTIFCLNTAPVCFSFMVKPSYQNGQNQDYSLHEICSQDNKTVSSNQGLPAGTSASSSTPPAESQGTPSGAGSSGSSSTVGQPGQGAPTGAPAATGQPGQGAPTGVNSPAATGQPGQGAPTGMDSSGDQGASTSGSNSMAPTQSASSPATVSSEAGQTVAGTGSPSPSPQRTCLCTA